MLPDLVSNPGPLTYESGVLPIALRGPATIVGQRPAVFTLGADRVVGIYCICFRLRYLFSSFVSALQIHVRLCFADNIELYSFLIDNICCNTSLEPSLRDGSKKRSQRMFCDIWKIIPNTSLLIPLIWSPARVYGTCTCIK